MSYDLVDLDKTPYHFLQEFTLRDTQKKELSKISPKAIEVNPLIFHFALYTDEKVVANRNKNTRAPRIYFMLGKNGVIYILFFDPYHEINPIQGINHK